MRYLLAILFLASIAFAAPRGASLSVFGKEHAQYGQQINMSFNSAAAPIFIFHADGRVTINGRKIRATKRTFVLIKRLLDGKCTR